MLYKLKTITLLLEITAITSFVYAGIRMFTLAIPYLMQTFNLADNVIFQQIITTPPFVYYLTAIKLPLHAITTLTVTIIAGIIFLKTAGDLRKKPSTKPLVVALITVVVLSFFGTPSLILALGTAASIIGLVQMERPINSQEQS
jgi:hypothetical protein